MEPLPLEAVPAYVDSDEHAARVANLVACLPHVRPRGLEQVGKLEPQRRHDVRGRAADVAAEQRGPSSPSLTDKLATPSSCAGQRTAQPAPFARGACPPRSRASRTRRTAADDAVTTRGARGRP